jgi:8-oxo-dGTP pyrophosphatase MutT (NUDIX family)
MMPAPSHKVNTELDDLSRAYGYPVIVSETLRIKTMFGALDERPAEVVPVIKRPNGCLVAMIKDNYPAAAYRLPSGGIHKGEPILDALLRESYEETGLRVVVRRFLAIVRYQVIIATGRTGRFTSYAFLVEGDGPLAPQDPNERIADLREVAVTDLRPMADFLHNLRTEGENDWNDWGRYRAVVHRAVAEVLDPQEREPSNE